MATSTDLGKWMITNGGEYDPDATYEKLTMVMYGGSTYITMQTVHGVTPEDDRINYMLMARGFDADSLDAITAKDTGGVLGDVGATVSAQSLVDWLSDQVMNQVLKKTDLVNNSLATIPGVGALDAVMGKDYQDQITKLYSDLDERTAVSDLLAVADVGLNSRRIVRYNANTLNSPFKAGVSGTIDSGTAIICSGSSGNYITIIAFPEGGASTAPCICKKTNGTWGAWSLIVTETNYESQSLTSSLLETPILLQRSGKVKSFKIMTYLKDKTTGITQGTSYTIGTLPEKYRPSVNVSFYKIGGRSGYTMHWYWVEMATTGVIKIAPMQNINNNAIVINHAYI